MYTIQIVDSNGASPFYFESESEYKEIINLLKNTCAGQGIQKDKSHFIFRAYSDEARIKVANFHTNFK